MKHSSSPIEVPQWESLDLLASEQLGRICVIDQAGVPIAFPVNYALATIDGRRVVVLRVAPTSSIAQTHGPVSFEVDRVEPELGRAWSVIVRGPMRVADGPGLLPDSKPWAEVGRHRWLTLEIASISGRRFVPVPTNDTFAVEWQQSGV